MIRFLRYIMVLFFMMVAYYPSVAQVQVAPKQQQSQRQIDERLARQFYNAKEYAQAKDLYKKLYEEYYQFQYLSQFVECLLYLGEYDEPEKLLKAYIKGDNTTNKWKAQVELANVYRHGGEPDKMERQLKKIIQEVPSNRSAYTQVANMMRSRDFNEYAIMLYDKGSNISEINSRFYMEKALTYQSMMMFDKATENYLLQLESDPNTYEAIKTRLSFMIRYDVDNSVIDDIRIALLQKTQQNPDNEDFADLLIWFSLQMQDYDIAMSQVMAMDKRFSDREYDILYLAGIAKDNAQYEVAIQGYDYLAKKSREGAYYSEAVVGLIEVQYELSKIDNNTDENFYKDFSERIEVVCRDIGINDKTISIVNIMADILAFHMKDELKAIDILNNTLTLNITKYNMATVKMKLADIYLYYEDVWEATLLYSQVDKSMKEEPIGHEARYRNARLRYYIGEYEWSLAVLNILKSSTSKLIANDAMTLSLLISDNLEYDTIALQRLSKADYYIYQQRYSLANQMLDSINMYNPNEVSMPYLLSRKAQIAMNDKDYELADSLYRRIYEGYSDSYIADKALLDNAILLERYLDRKEDAMECYAKLIDEFTASVYVAQARNAYRRLREIEN